MIKIPSIDILGRRIAADSPPYVIAELSANHNGNINTALGIIEKAKLCGVDAVKLQTYTPDTITLNSRSDDFRIQKGPWAGKTLYELYQDAHMPWDWHKPIFEYARSIGITIFSSPFDKTAVDLLEDLNAPAYKIASFEAVDLELIKYAAGTGKPMIISTGMADKDEITEAINAAREGGCNEIAVLHCVSGYPAPAEDYNILTIPDIVNRYGLVAGLSDHTLGIATAIASVSLGASIIEKHFTLDRSGGGPDDSFSLEPCEMSELCKAVSTAWRSMGKIHYGRKASEIENLMFRRSLYYVKDVAMGDFVTEECIRSIRPGFGLPPKYFRQLIGKRMKVSVKSGTATNLDQFE